MKSKILIIICIVLVLAVVYKLSLLLILEKNVATYPSSLWNKTVVDKYEDEPSLKDYKVVSASGWIVPPDPATTTKTLDFNFNGYSDIWNKWSTFKDDLEKQNLEKKYYNYFFQHGQLPISSQEADVNGDNKKDKLFQSISVGCASCHFQNVDIFVDDKIYSTYTYDGNILPRKDQKGFYISYVQGEGNPHSIIIRRFEWNGDGFTEIARKTVFLKK